MSTWGGAALGLEQRLLHRLRTAGVALDAPLVVAFSGGPDSLALAAALTHVRAVTGLDLQLVHVDHRLRASSGDEAEAVAELGRQLGVDTVIRRVTVAPQEAHPHVGVEEAARRERYRELLAAARLTDARIIATGHHREDQAETVLLHLLRGSGLHGAAGMAELGELPLALTRGAKPQEDVRLWRPFLSEPRREILAYLAKRNLTPLADPSNADERLRRNALRRRVLPEMERAVPGASAALARYATLAAEEDRFLEGLVDEALSMVLSPAGGLRHGALVAQPVSLQRRLVRRWLVARTGESEMTAERVEAVRRWSGMSRPGGSLQLPGGWSVHRDGASLIVARGSDENGGEERERDGSGAAGNGSSAHPD